MIPFEKELATTIARNMREGEIEIFPIVEMMFNEISNQVKFVLCPAQIDEILIEKAKQVALSVSNSFKQIGLLAVEMFLTKSGRFSKLRVAPRLCMLTTHRKLY